MSLMKWVNELRWNNLQTQTKKAKFKTLCDMCHHVMTLIVGGRCEVGEDLPIYCLYVTRNFLTALYILNHMNVLLIQIINCI